MSLRDFYSDKTVVITGAANGIGAALARRAASLDMNLVLIDISISPLEVLASSFKNKCLVLKTDVSDAAAVEEAARTAFEEFEHIDLVFNNAGIMSMGLSWEIPLDVFKRQIAVNLEGCFNVIHSFIPKLLSKQQKSRIINTASLASFSSFPLNGAYASTKFAVVGLTEALHFDLRMIDAPVDVSLLIPGSVNTEIFATAYDTVRNENMRNYLKGSQTRQNIPSINADECALCAFIGIERGDYWLIPQPEFIDNLVPARAKMILNREVPELPNITGLPSHNTYKTLLNK